MSQAAARPAVDLAKRAPARPGIALALALIAVPGVTIAWDIGAALGFAGVLVGIAAFLVGAQPRSRAAGAPGTLMATGAAAIR